MFRVETIFRVYAIFQRLSLSFSKAHHGRSGFDSNQQTNRQCRSADTIALRSGTSLVCSLIEHNKVEKILQLDTVPLVSGFNTAQACTHLGFQPSFDQRHLLQHGRMTSFRQNDISQHESTKHGRMTLVSISQPSMAEWHQSA